MSLRIVRTMAPSTKAQAAAKIDEQSLQSPSHRSLWRPSGCGAGGRTHLSSAGNAEGKQQDSPDSSRSSSSVSLISSSSVPDSNRAFGHDGPRVRWQCPYPRGPDYVLIGP